MNTENCTNNYNHEYAEKKCTCGHVFCWTCCKSNGEYQGEKWCTCPKCGADWYEGYYDTWEPSQEVSPVEIKFDEDIEKQFKAAFPSFNQ